MRTKAFLGCVFICANLAVARASDSTNNGTTGVSQPELRIKLDFVEHRLATNDPRFRDSKIPPRLDHYPDFHFHAVIENVSSHPIYLWNAVYSEGFEALSFVLINADGTRVEIKRPDYSYSVNEPVLDKLDPGDIQVRDIYCATQEMCSEYHVSPPRDHFWNPEFPFGQNGTVTLQAIFEQKSSSVPHPNLWIGRVVSALYPVVL